jgi:hypothetical protein
MLFAANVVLAADHVVYQAILAGHIGFYLLAGLGAVLEFAGRLRAEATARNLPETVA